MRRRYEIHDKQWEIIKGMLPEPEHLMVPEKACTLGFAAGKCRACRTRFLKIFQLNLTSKM